MDAAVAPTLPAAAGPRRSSRAGVRPQDGRDTSGVWPAGSGTRQRGRIGARLALWRAAAHAALSVPPRWGASSRLRQLAATAVVPATPPAGSPSPRVAATVALDAYVPGRVRVHLEQTYYARVSAQATLAHLMHDPGFLDDPTRQVALFSDHGIVHVRDIAARILDVLDTVHGVWMRRRSRERLEGFMKSYGVLLAYLHDIGMADLSPRGRAAHAAFVAQVVFTPALDAVVEAVWAANSGGIAGRLRALVACGALAQEPSTVLREMLAMASAHSKSSVPHDVLVDPARLRRIMQETLRTDLWTLYRDHKQGHGAAADAASATSCRTMRQTGPVDLEALAAQHPQGLCRFYADVEQESFGWLVCPHPQVRALVDDVVETVRALRCADALRQRGTALKTSGAYEMFVEQATAEAIYALRHGPDHVFLLRLSDPLAAGEANLARSWVSRAGDLHIAFQRGAFATPEAVERAAHDAAVVIDDIQSDVLGSFAPARHYHRRDPVHRRGRCGTGQRTAGWRIVLEGVGDNPAFTALVRAQLQRRNPRLYGRVRTTPALPPVPETALTDGTGMEEARYAAASALDWNRGQCQAALKHIAATGHRMPYGDSLAAFMGVRMVTLQPGETLIEAGTSPAFVYIPLANGLSVLPVGGYAPATVGAWVPVGHTGVIRGAPRNATVIARRALALLVLPRELYLRWWHHPYSAAELSAHLTRPGGVAPARSERGAVRVLSRRPSPVVDVFDRVLSQDQSA